MIVRSIRPKSDSNHLCQSNRKSFEAQNPMRKLAKLNAIQAFESVARTHSYAAAARELHVTPAAVGQQVRALEAWLGRSLFQRLSRGSQRLVLTPDAQRAAAEFREGLDRLDAGIQRLHTRHHDQGVTVSASQAFVAKWLMPRLDGFTSAHPQWDVRLDVSDRLVDVQNGDTDIAIRCGSGHWPGVTAIRLMDEQMFPVCSPTLFSKRKPIVRATDLLRHTLIHDVAMLAFAGFPTWAQWFERAGVTVSRMPRGLEINASGAAIQAAVTGQGIALARSVLVADDLKEGRLIRLVPEIDYPLSWGYYLVYAPARASSEASTAFRAWLSEAAQERPRVRRRVR
jgi:LysR family transcriptional regulator, glycine cleavage system transcriptional activator